jgi:hypothetical protein
MVLAVEMEYLPAASYVQNRLSVEVQLPGMLRYEVLRRKSAGSRHPR